MKRISAILLACICTTISIKAFTVVDASSGDPVVAASVFDARGTILGITDEKGKFATDASTRFPLSIRCIGYSNTEARSAADDVILMDFCSYQLPEASVTDYRDGLKVTCYIRNYITVVADNDTIISFAENMADVVLPTRKKIKGFKGHDTPRILNTRSYTLYARSNGTDSVAGSEEPDNSICSNIVLISKLDTVTWKETKRLRDMEMGFDTMKVNKNATMVIRKTPSTLTFNGDVLAGRENHIYSPNALKFLGMTTDFYEMYRSDTFYRNSGYRYRLPDLFQRCYSIGATGRGKMWKYYYKAKNNVDLKMSVEIYPVDFEYLTVEECKELDKNKKYAGKIDFRLPANVPPLDPVTLRLVEQVNALPKE